MGEKSEGGELIHLGIERKKREFDSKIDEAEKLIDELERGNKKLGALRDKNKPELIRGLIKMRKTIIKLLTDRELNPDKAREMLDEINEAERGIKNND